LRVVIHFGDVVEESDGDLIGGGINIAARLEGVAKPGAFQGQRPRPHSLKNIAELRAAAPAIRS
jgi:hypothetical protein